MSQNIESIQPFLENWKKKGGGWERKRKTKNCSQYEENSINETGQLVCELSKYR